MLHPLKPSSLDNKIFATEPANPRWRIEVLPNELDAARKQAVGIEDPGPVYASRYVLRRLQQKLRKQKRHLLFFIHGYNNMEAVLNRAALLEKTYPVEVLTFTWPARGGGVRGKLSYRSDKSAAEESTPALMRLLERFGEYMRELEEAQERRLFTGLSAETLEECEVRDRALDKETQKSCPFTVNFLAHSMGCFLVRKIVEDFTPPPDFSFFENLVLAAADANNPGHGAWINQLNPRQNVYITLNERDFALRLSQRKLGRRQQRRLGNTARNFESPTALYVNFTQTKAVGDAHTYFVGEAIDKNHHVKTFFREAFHGLLPEYKLKREEAMNGYRVP